MFSSVRATRGRRSQDSFRAGLFGEHPWAAFRSQNMRNGLRRSKLELRGPRSGLGIYLQSSGG
eukprot:12703050-Alexandrium_andersonii.AAC.1